MKWEEERAKREGAASMLTERYEDIFLKEEGYVKCLEIKEEKRRRGSNC